MSTASLSISAGIGLSYIGLYTGYDKATKTLKSELVIDFFTLRRGWDWTLVEANKALSLTGLTTMLVSFLPLHLFGGLSKKVELRKELLLQSMSMLWLHSCYSMYKFYGNSPKRILEDKPLKQASIFLGMCGQMALIGGYWGFISKEALVAFATCFGVSHFYTYELDYKGILQVRPSAYLPFPLAAAVCYFNGNAIGGWICRSIFARN
jgi:hypothetical protein